VRREIAWKRRKPDCAGAFRSLERKGQAANRNPPRRLPASYPRSFGRSIASSWHIDRRNVGGGLWTARVVRGARPAHSPLYCNQNQGDSRRHQSCSGEGGTTAGEFLKTHYVADHPIDAPTLDQDSPRRKKKKTENAVSNPAHQSLFTDVLRVPPFSSARIHQCKNFTMRSSWRRENRALACLTGDIRMGWSGRAPAPPASEADKGRQRQGARHVLRHPILRSP